MSFEEYNKKRDFSKTPEPTGKEKGEIGDQFNFVVQKHNAARLHYDFRLEVDGVLKSWAIPKGPSLDPEEKRLAVRTEDHPLEYSSFEGVIPEGEYGAGEVIVWDKGAYKNAQEENGKEVPMNKTIENGHVEVELEGEKLKGKFSLIKTSLRGKGDSWLLVKMRDQYADKTKDIMVAEPQSVVSGKTIEELQKEK